MAASRLSSFRATPPIHVRGGAAKTPTGLTPAQMRAAYNLPTSGGHGTVAVVIAFDHPAAEKDLNVFSRQFGLPPCTVKNGCFERHKMSAAIKTNASWSLEAALDTQWAHAIAPDAKILLVEAPSGKGADLLSAVDYARRRQDVVAVSMSWGGAEFAGEADLDGHFTSDRGVTFFASSGDDGTGVSWPAASMNVVGVGGTTLTFTKSGSFYRETAWSGSGGGVSAYEPQPAYQVAYNIKKAKGMRAVPDVSFNADPQSGNAVYSSAKGKGGWYVLGGTSAGAPQWAAIKALGLTAGNDNFYADKASAGSTRYFRDILSGTNGDCGYFCTARRHYDYVTGLGSPLGTTF